MVKGSLNFASLNFGIITLILFLINSFDSAVCQEKTYYYFYRVYLKDKGANDAGNFSPADLFSEKAVERRIKAGISIPDFRDIPVWSDYIDQISSLGFALHCTSRWMNTALFKTATMADITSLTSLPFVSNVKIVKNAGGKNQSGDKLSFNTTQDDLPPFNLPLIMVNGETVRNSGLTGKGVLIAVLDGGFLNADNIPSLKGLRSRNGIKGTFDFVENKESVYDFHNHGTAVMSVLAGSIPESIEGTATGADYLLLRSEDTGSEFPVEEDFWTAAAEYADSIGADIISSSLGYSTFDDPLMDYKFSDLDGNSTFISRAADIAASKGILVVNSAGNERNKAWIRIIAPSDGDSVLAVGAVDGFEIISAFSSAGPSFDGRVKPDVVSLGVSVPVQVLASEVSRSSGTSFSCPIISGMCACILQAVPGADNSEIISALRSSADRSLRPDSLYGYGIPDIAEIIIQLQEKYIPVRDEASVASPNPFKNELKITFREIPEKLRLEIYDLSGKLVMKKNYQDYVSRILIIDDLSDLRMGFYFIRLITPSGTFTHKIIKANNRL